MSELFKDEPSINHRSKLNDQMKELVNKVKLVEASNNKKETLRELFLNNMKSKGEHNPEHNGCTGCFDSGRMTEKRL